VQVVVVPQTVQVDEMYIQGLQRALEEEASWEPMEQP
jgi:hypothetical protein